MRRGQKTLRGIYSLLECVRLKGLYKVYITQITKGSGANFRISHHVLSSPLLRKARCNRAPQAFSPESLALLAGGFQGAGFFHGVGFCQLAWLFQNDFAWPVTGCHGLSFFHGFCTIHGFELCHHELSGFFHGDRFFQGNQTCGSRSSRCTRPRMWRVPMSCAAHSGIATATSGRLFWRGGRVSKSCSVCSTAAAGWCSDGMSVLAVVE